ncbi:MAG TPA: FHA domain-containing protein [Kofleriaceae bacterium]
MVRDEEQEDPPTTNRPAPSPPPPLATAKRPEIDAPAARLVDMSKQRHIAVPCDQFTIGRSSNSNLVLKDICVSRQQAVITCKDGQFFISSVGKAPVLVNEDPGGVFEQKYLALQNEPVSATNLPLHMSNVKQELLNTGPSAEETAKRVQSLAEQAIRSKQLAETRARKENKNNTNSTNFARQFFMHKHKLNDSEKKKVSELSKEMFARLQNLCEQGANARVVLDKESYKEPKYGNALEILASRGNNPLTQSAYRRLTEQE